MLHSLKIKSSLEIFFSAVGALLTRELYTRFGTTLGYAWALADTFVQVGVFVAVKELLMAPLVLAYDYTVFLAVSFLAYNLFRSVVLRSMPAYEANRPLFMYKKVKPFDAVVARFLLEWMIMLSSFSVLFAIGISLGKIVSPKDIVMTLFAVAWFSLFTFSVGFLISILGELSDSVKKVVDFLFTPLMFVSAVFYPASVLPAEAKEYVLYNPIANFLEFLRSAYFATLDTSNVDFYYMAWWTFVPLFVGLVLYAKYEKRIIAA